MEEERTAHEQKLAKMEAEMRAVFQAKVQEKEQKLKHSEEEASDPMKTCCIEFSYAYPFFILFSFMLVTSKWRKL